MPDKKSTINLLDSIADMMEFKGENQFKVNAYRNASASIRRYEYDLLQAAVDKKLGEIKGVGKGIQAVLYEYFETGESSLYTELKKEVPEGIEKLLTIRGLGAKKILQLYSLLGISNIGELEQACKENRLMLLKGFGEATQKKIMDEIAKQKYYSKYIRLHTAGLFAEEVLVKLKKIEAVRKIEISGELRRGSEIISSLVFTALVSEETSLFIELNKLYKYETTENIVNIHEEFAVPVRLHITKTEDEFIKELMLTTGSESFLEQTGINFIEMHETDESELFKTAGLEYVIPEMREPEYFQASEEYRENSDLEAGLFIGLLHFHTTHSDGRNTLAEMITAGKEFGYQYAAVCDHSKSAAYANGLNEERVLQQKEEVKKLSAELGFQIFQGIESDILQNGDLDYEKDFLSEFDIVVASVHSRFSMTEPEMTQRIINAVENEFTDILGHPSGRLLLSRDPYQFNVKKVIDACAANQVAIEINSNPYRLDLDWRHIYYAREKGCYFSINQDAHSTEELSLLQYGIKMGRKGGLQSREVINCLELKEFKKFLQRKIKARLTK